MILKFKRNCNFLKKAKNKHLRTHYKPAVIRSKCYWHERVAMGALKLDQGIKRNTAKHLRTRELLHVVLPVILLQTTEFTLAASKAMDLLRWAQKLLELN
jgi:hypothetical protein